MKEQDKNHSIRAKRNEDKKYDREFKVMVIEIFTGLEKSGSK